MICSAGCSQPTANVLVLLKAGRLRAGGESSVNHGAPQDGPGHRGKARCIAWGPRVPGKRDSAFLQLWFRHYRLDCGMKTPKGAGLEGEPWGKLKWTRSLAGVEEAWLWVQRLLTQSPCPEPFPPSPPSRPTGFWRESSDRSMYHCEFSSKSETDVCMGVSRGDGGQHRQPPMSSGGQLSTEQRTPARAADFRAAVFICYMGVKTGPLHGMVVKSE